MGVDATARNWEQHNRERDANWDGYVKAVAALKAEFRRKYGSKFDDGDEDVWVEYIPRRQVLTDAYEEQRDEIYRRYEEKRDRLQ